MHTDGACPLACLHLLLQLTAGFETEIVAPKTSAGVPGVIIGKFVSIAVLFCWACSQADCGGWPLHQKQITSSILPKTHQAAQATPTR